MKHFNKILTSMLLLLVFATTNLVAQTISTSNSSIVFANTLVNTTAVIPFAVAGTSLTPTSGNLTVTAPSGYTISTSATGTFASTASIAYAAATFNASSTTMIYIKYTPTSTSAVGSTNITVAGGGAPTVNVSVSCSGGITTFGAPSTTLYRTLNGGTSGNWSAVGTWETSNDGGTSWSAASAVPTGNENIYIQPGYNVTVDAAASVSNITGYIKNNGTITNAATTTQATVAAATTSGSAVVTLSASNASIAVGQLINAPTNTSFPPGTSVVGISGTSLTLSQNALGNMTSAITYSFYSNYFTFTTGTYDHSQDGGTIPISSWNTTSTCLISGVVVFAPTTNLSNSQNFGNFTWDCSNQGNVTGLTVATMNWCGVTIKGNVYFKNTGTTGVGGGNSSGSVRITSASPFSNSNILAVPITINGDLIIGSSTTLGKVSTSGSSGLQVYNVTVKGNVNIGTSAFGGSTWGMAGGSGGPAIITLTGTNGNGDFMVAGTGSTLTANNATKVIFAKAGIQVFSYPTSASVGLVTWEVSNGTTLNLGSQIISGSGGFNMNSGATLISSISTFSGGNIQTSNKLINAGANFILNGSSAQTLAFPSTSSVVAYSYATAIASGTSVTLSVANSNIQVGQTVTGTSIAANTTVAAISGTSLTLSTALSASLPANTALTFNNATVSNQTINNLTVNNSAGVTISTMPITINGALAVSAGTLTTGVNLNLGNAASATIGANAVLSITGGITDFNGRSIVLQSTASGTGRIAQIAGTLNNATNVTTQLYIPGGRRTSRFISQPFTGALNMGSLIDNIYVTGAGSGFDATATNNPSAFWFDNTGATWTAFTSTSDNSWTQYRGIRVLVRGDRTQTGTLTGANPTPNAVTLDMTGAINTGNANIVLGAAGYHVVGNPYPSPVDIGTVIDATANTGNQYWVWDANGGVSSGAYTTKLTTAGGGGGVYNLATNGAFVVQLSGAATMAFTEANKTSTATSQLFGSSSSNSQLLGLEVLYNGNHVDNLFVRKEANAKAEKEQYDGNKFTNPDLNFYALSADNQKLSLDTRSFDSSTNIRLGLVTTKQNNYQIKVANYNFDNTSELYLNDKYTNTLTLLQADKTYDFSVTADAATQGESRFELMMKPAVKPIIPSAHFALQVATYPNPATEFVKISFANAEAANTIIVISNIDGKVVKTIDAGMVQSGQFDVNVKPFAKGSYFITLNNGKERKIQKIQVQ